MKKPKPPGLVSDIEKEVGETVKAGKEQVSLGKAFSELLRQIFGGAKPLSPEQMQELKDKEEKAERKARAEVLRPFFKEPPTKEERAYERRQREEAVKRMKEEEEVKKKAEMTILEAPKGRKKRGSLFEFLRRKVTKTERKIGGKF